MATATGYGNWRRPHTSAFLGFTKLAVYISLAASLVMILAMQSYGIMGGVVTFGVTAVVVVLTSWRNRYGYTLYELIGLWVMWWRSKASGANTFVGGALSRKGTPTAQLPGILGATRLIEATDSQGRSFVVVEHTRLGLYTLVIAASPDGLALVDESTIDNWVANWGQFLADLGHEPGLVGASVVVETAPDTGSGLRDAVEPRIDPAAPAVAQEMLREVVATYPVGSAHVGAYVTLTYQSAVRKGSRKRQRAEVIRDLSARVQVIMDGLHSTGAGHVRVMDAASLCKLVRCSFDPDAVARYLRAEMEGQPVSVDWGNVGPISAKAHWDFYQHDGAKSMTWEMVEAPTGVVRSDVLVPLLAPHPELERKRLTILYRPFEAGLAAKTVDRDHRNAAVAASSGPRPTAREVKDLGDAAQAAREEAAGAGVEDFALLLTVTCGYRQDFSEITGLVDSLSASSRCRLRPCYGQQDAAFATSLPLGVVPGRFDLMPEAMKEMM